MSYGTIVADPPWEYPEGCVALGPGHGILRAAQPLPYPSMTFEAICECPVRLGLLGRSVARNGDATVKYRTIVADPPWPYENREGGGYDVISKQLVKNGSRLQRSVREMGYQGMPLDEILILSPPADDSAHLYLWTTNAFMDEAYDVARAWNFKPKTILTWTKTHQGDPARVSMKTGYYFRGATEHCLFCVRGSLRLQTAEGLPTGYLWPRLPHSVKPDAFYDLVEKASPGPYLELFARRARLGDWHYWGDQSLETTRLAFDEGREA